MLTLWVHHVTCGFPSPPHILPGEWVFTHFCRKDSSPFLETSSVSPFPSPLKFLVSSGTSLIDYVSFLCVPISNQWFPHWKIACSPWKPRFPSPKPLLSPKALRLREDDIRRAACCLGGPIHGDANLRQRRRVVHAVASRWWKSTPRCAKHRRVFETTGRSQKINLPNKPPWDTKMIQLWKPWPS